jgi:hypothetical protein
MRPKVPPELIPNENHAEYQANARISNRLQRIGRMLEKELTKAAGKEDDVHFALLVFHGGRVQYCSNAERDSIRDAMKELVSKWDIPGADLGPVDKKLGGMN